MKKIYFFHIAAKNAANFSKKSAKLTGIKEINNSTIDQFIQCAITPFIIKNNSSSFKYEKPEYMLLSDGLYISFVAESNIKFDFKQIKKFYRYSGIRVYFSQIIRSEFHIIELTTKTIDYIPARTAKFYKFMSEQSFSWNQIDKSYYFSGAIKYYNQNLRPIEIMRRRARLAFQTLIIQNLITTANKPEQYLLAA